MIKLSKKDKEDQDFQDALDRNKKFWEQPWEKLEKIRLKQPGVWEKSLCLNEMEEEMERRGMIKGGKVVKDYVEKT